MSSFAAAGRLPSGGFSPAGSNNSYRLAVSLLRYDEDATRAMRELSNTEYSSLDLNGGDQPLFTPRINRDHRASSSMSRNRGDIFMKLYENAIDKQQKDLSRASHSAFVENEKMWQGFRADASKGHSTGYASSRTANSQRPPWDGATVRASSQHRPRDTQPSRSAWTRRASQDFDDEARLREAKLRSLRSKSPPFVRHTQASLAKRRTLSETPPQRSATPPSTPSGRGVSRSGSTTAASRPVSLSERLQLLAKPKQQHHVSVNARPIAASIQHTSSRPVIDAKRLRHSNSSGAMTTTQPAAPSEGLSVDAAAKNPRGGAAVSVGHEDGTAAAVTLMTHTAGLSDSAPNAAELGGNESPRAETATVTRAGGMAAAVPEQPTRDTSPSSPPPPMRSVSVNSSQATSTAALAPGTPATHGSLAGGAAALASLSPASAAEGKAATKSAPEASPAQQKRRQIIESMRVDSDDETSDDSEKSVQFNVVATPEPTCATAASAPDDDASAISPEAAQQPHQETESETVASLRFDEVEGGGAVATSGVSSEATEKPASSLPAPQIATPAAADPAAPAQAVPDQPAAPATASSSNPAPAAGSALSARASGLRAIMQQLEAV